MFTVRFQFVIKKNLVRLSTFQKMSNSHHSQCLCEKVVGRRIDLLNVKNDEGQKQKSSVFVKASPAEGPRRLHRNTANAHLWGFTRPFPRKDSQEKKQERKLCREMKKKREFLGSTLRILGLTRHWPEQVRPDKSMLLLAKTGQTKTGQFGLKRFWHKAVLA